MKNSRIVVRNLDLAKPPEGNPVIVYCVGYETRSRFFAEQYGAKPEDTIAILYSTGHSLAFYENKEFAAGRKYRIVPDEEVILEKAIAEIIAKRRVEGRFSSILIDVSAMDRSLLARVLTTALDEIRCGEKIELVYSPGEFKKPTKSLVPIRRIGPVHKSLLGELASPDCDRIAIIGIGYEYGVSLNILETHEPDMAFVFRPNGPDERFLGAVEEANFGFDFGERNYEIVDYFLDDMAGAYDDISNLITSAKDDSSIVCVPMGPKILSAVMILAALVHQPFVSVLRYSVASPEQPVDTRPEGSLVGISVMKIPAKREVGVGA